MDYKNIKDVYTGHLYDTQYVTFLLKENNKELYACGDNLYGQLGLNKYTYPSFGKIFVSDVKDIINDKFKNMDEYSFEIKINDDLIDGEFSYSYIKFNYNNMTYEYSNNILVPNNFKYEEVLDYINVPFVDLMCKYNHK